MLEDAFRFPIGFPDALYRCVEKYDEDWKRRRRRRKREEERGWRKSLSQARRAPCRM
jgi:hypothetical protein